MTPVATQAMRNDCSVSGGAKWRAKMKRNDSLPQSAVKVTSKSDAEVVAELNKKLAATRAKRHAASETNAMKLIGRTRL